MSRSLVSPLVDTLILGAMPLLLTLAAAIWSDIITPTVALTLVAILSFPHFMGSYFVFYGMQGPWRQHWQIAFVLPITLIAICIFALSNPTTAQVLGHAALILLYWHYAKQTYGISLWLGQMNGTAIRGRGRDIILVCCLLLGAIALLRAEQGSASFSIFGFYLKPLDIPPDLVAIGRYLAWMALGIMTLYLLTPQARQSRHWLAFLPIAALASWSDPYLISPAVLAILPIFHGTQYLPFPLRVTYKYLTEHHPKHANLSFVFIWFSLAGSGYWLFRTLPIMLSGLSPIFPVAAVVLLTLNIHHYFVDAVLWRFQQIEVTRRL